jgi:hypothetical protein
MSSPPLDPWVANTRKVILWLGFGWPAGIFMMGLWNSQQAAAWEIILLSLLGAFFIPPAIVLSLILPTYKSRIIAVPLILLSWELVRSPHDSSFTLQFVLLEVVPWRFTITAITLLIPQFPWIGALFRRIFFEEE